MNVFGFNFRWNNTQIIIKACNNNQGIEIQLQLFIVLKKFNWPILELRETEKKKKRLNNWTVKGHRIGTEKDL